MNDAASTPEPKEEPKIEITSSRGFPSWLAGAQASLAITTYQTGKLFLIGLQPNGRLSIFERTLERVMGMHATAQSIHVSTLYQIRRFHNMLQPGQTFDDYDAPQWLRFGGIVKELYDVGILPGVIRPMAIGFKSDEIRRYISFE